MAFDIGAALSFGSKALGFLGGGGKKGGGGVRLRKLRDRALRAGFNPLTVLRATGGQGFSAPNPGLSSLEMLAGITGAGADYFEATDPVLQETARLERDLLRAQIDRFNAETANARRSSPGFNTSPLVRSSATTQQPSWISKPGDLSFGAPYGTPEGGVPEGRKVPTDARPATVMRDDGLTAGNPDAPREAEVDLWQWAVDGTLLENSAEIARRNEDIGRGALRWFVPLLPGGPTYSEEQMEVFREEGERAARERDRQAPYGPFGGPVFSQMPGADRWNMFHDR